VGGRVNEREWIWVPLNVLHRADVNTRWRWHREAAEADEDGSIYEAVDVNTPDRRWLKRMRRTPENETAVAMLYMMGGK